MNHIQPVDQFGNVGGREAQRAYSLDNMEERGIPEGCQPYDNQGREAVVGSNDGIHSGRELATPVSLKIEKKA